MSSRTPNGAAQLKPSNRTNPQPENGVTPTQNKTLLAAVFADTATGQGRLFLDTLAEDVRWTIMGTTAWSKTYLGKASVINDLLRPR